MRDLAIVFGVICALISLGISLYDYLERRNNHEQPKQTDEK